MQPQALGLDPDVLENCILRCAAGEREGLAALYELTRSAVYGFALSIVRNADDAEELTQDTYVQVYRGAGRYQPRHRPMAWLLTITRNLSLNRLKERERLVHLEEGAVEMLPARPELTPEDRLALRSLLEDLGEQERQIVSLHALGGLKHREIGGLLHIPLPTVLSRYSRAMKKLRKAWEEANL